jgi:hypothetical protein
MMRHMGRGKRSVISDVRAGMFDGGCSILHELAGRI